MPRKLRSEVNSTKREGGIFQAEGTDSSAVGGNLLNIRGHMKAGEVESRPDRLEGCSGPGPCGPRSVSKGREGSEGLRGGDATRRAFREVLLAAVWRSDQRRTRAREGGAVHPPG